MTKITVVGTGYVGLVSGACLADFGNHVICLDNNHEKITQLKNGVIPIFEPGLDDVVKRTVQRGSLHFSTEWNQYRTLDFPVIAADVQQKVCFDFRNIYKRADIESQCFTYVGVGT